MPSKKPSPTPASPAKPTTQPPARGSATSKVPNTRQQPDNRWQRTKRYGWDSR